MEPLLLFSVFASLLVAAAMSVVAWRLARDTRARAAARIELLTNLAFAEGVPVHPAPARDEPWETEFQSETGAPVGAMFSARQEPSAPGRRWVALAAVAVLMAGTTAAFTLFSDAAPASPAERAGAVAPAAESRDAPIELLSLQHRTTASGTFDVTGVVRNPAEGRPLHDMVAVVDLFGPHDRLLTSRRQPIELPVLLAGESSAFSVAIPKAAGVARYRVEFRLNGRDTIAHVDLRTEGP